MDKISLAFVILVLLFFVNMRNKQTFILTMIFFANWFDNEPLSIFLFILAAIVTISMIYDLAKNKEVKSLESQREKYARFKAEYDAWKNMSLEKKKLNQKREGQ